MTMPFKTDDPGGTMIPASPPPAQTDTETVARAVFGVLAGLAAGRLRAPGPTLGLAPERYAAMIARYRGYAERDYQLVDIPAATAEFDDLVRLFIDHCAHDGPEIEWLAHVIACGCMGDDHLYQDMNLPNRQALSDLLRAHFTALFDKNTGNMKWKKFFYKQLCERAEVKACSAPSCQECSDYGHCFGPEEPAPLPFIPPNRT
jgi:nitrogen fixation protein NifQ